MTTPDTQSLQSAINLLREAVSRRFGPGSADADIGEATLYINDDSIELTDENGTVIAWDAEQVAEALK